MVAPIRRELGIFLIVGLVTVGIDFLGYHGLMNFKPLGFESINLAKAFGFISGSIFAYFANRLWTFNQHGIRPGSAYRFAILYVFSLATNVAVNLLVIVWLDNSTITLDIILLIAFILATGVSAGVNFIGMKFFVFTNHHYSK